ncbi:MAG: DUF3604 domain-containing protein [Chloroflexi bacterium]|nr:DUF3604 domain-containing protein [Chloroflexota bacterium]
MSTSDQQAGKWGSLELVSAPQVEAGELASIHLRFVAGGAGLFPGGTVSIDTNSDSDWAPPQLGDASADGYLKVTPPAGRAVSVHTPDHKSIVITLQSGELKSGESIDIVLGDRSGGGGGLRAQTFYEPRRNFLCEVDPTGDGTHGSAEMAVLRIAGGNAESLSAIAPSDIEVGSSFALLLKAEDRWGNPAERYRGTVEVSAPGLILPDGNSLAFDEDDAGVRRIDGAVFTEAGATRIDLEDAQNGLSASSNQVRITQELPALKLFWGDPHSGQIADASKIGDYFTYAKEVSGLDFAGYQRNDSAHSTDDYDVQQVQEKAFHEPGRFVPLPGFEWSGNLAAGGHHNVYFSRFDLPMKRWNGADRLGRPGETDLPHVRDLYNYYRGTDTVITPHVGGQHADLQFHDPTLEPAVEVTSTHGSFEWILRESIERGYEMGFVGGNDCHTGRPGDDRPGHQERRYSKGGLTGVYADELTLKGILSAIKAKRVYATTGARIRAAVTVDGHFIGEKFSCSNSTCEIRVSVEGTAPLERIEVYRGLELVHTEHLAGPPTGSRIRVLWDGASRMSSYSGISWDGYIDVGDGEIGDVSPVRFDSPRSRYERAGVSRIDVAGWACGYPSGVVVDLTDKSGSKIKPDIEITVVLDSQLIIGETFGLHGEVGPRRMALAPGDSVRVSATLEQLADRAARVELGHLNRSVTLELAPEPATDRADFTVIDDGVLPGVNPYWVKVVQQDMEMAWISPVFADYMP